MKEVPKLSDFPVGKPNDAYAKYFIAQSWLAPLTTEQVPTYNVTLMPQQLAYPSCPKRRRSDADLCLRQRLGTTGRRTGS